MSVASKHKPKTLIFQSLEEAYGRIYSPKEAFTVQMVTDVASTAEVVLRIFNWRPQTNLESFK
jgi:hypothetical protein